MKRDNYIRSGHGSGGKLMHQMIEGIIKEILGPESVQLDDAAILAIPTDRIAFTTDSYTITPIFFPGGDIGKLAVCGTVNDLAVMGARPLWLSCALILEEGLLIDDFVSILRSMRLTADMAGVKIVTGDTKVVNKGAADLIYINTAGIGILESEPTRKNIEAGDVIISSGTIGDHGIAIMAARNKFSFSHNLVSDCAALHRMIELVCKKFPHAIKFIRDATRGGVAAVLHEIVKNRPWGAIIFEEQLPIRDEVKGICNLLGIDPLYVANEGKAIFVVEKTYADDVVQLLRSTKEGNGACIIGYIVTDFSGKVIVETAIGGRRLVPLLVEEQLPRIC
ncbi:MAG: hydrogenase expression/formation protein HypE [Spirochaetes bacterium]|nr:hydrogenase expression/formation protein HypE [Spirochaetota bacterium]